MDKTQEEKMRDLALELAKDLKTAEDLNALSTQLKKITVEAALGAEMEHHLGYAKHAREARNSGNKGTKRIAVKMYAKQKNSIA